MFSSIFLLPPECLQLSNVQRFPDLETFVRAVREISQSKQYEGSVSEEARHFSSMVAIFPTIKTLHNYSRELKVEKYLSIHFETFFKPLCFFQSGRLWCFNKSSPLVRSVVAGWSPPYWRHMCFANGKKDTVILNPVIFLCVSGYGKGIYMTWKWGNVTFHVSPVKNYYSQSTNVHRYDSEN